MADVRIEIYDANGVLLVNQDTLLLREITAFQITGAGAVDLSTMVPNPNAILPVPGNFTPDGYAAYSPRLTVSGKTVQWQRAGSNSGLNVRLSLQAF